MNNNEELSILGIAVSTLTRGQVDDRLQGFLKGGVRHYLVTPNPEIVLSASRDEELHHIINHADLAVPDGFGLSIAALFSGTKFHRYPGVEIADMLLCYAASEQLPVLIINRQGGLSRAADLEHGLALRYPGLVCRCLDIPFSIEHCLTDKDLEAAAVSFKPVLMLVTLGSPWQEKFIYRLQAQFPSLRLSAAVGGALDFLTGRQRRAPMSFRCLGLEWLWRLFMIPFYDDPLRRLKRIMNAIVVFPLVFIRWRFIRPFFYRNNVVCLLYRGQGAHAEILTLERADEHSHWQLPQGGTDGEKLPVAGRRELNEELHTDDFIDRGSFTDLYHYDFPVEKGGSRNSGHRGQRQGLYIAQFTGDDSDIALNYWDHRNWRWVGRDEVLSVVHECRREAMKIYLQKFDSLFDTKRI